MKREIKDKNILDKFCIKFCDIIEKHCKYIIVSGFLVISSGRTRGTEDIDMIMEKINLEKFKEIHKELTKNEFECIQSENPEEIYEYLTDNTSIRYILKNKPLPEMEIKFAKDALDEYQLKTRKKIPLTGLNIWFSSININIAFKEELLKSDKDIKDATHLRTVYNEEINEEEINKIKRLIKQLRL